jgi:hypothetical protein
VAEYPGETQSDTISRRSRGGIGCCGCCGLALGLLVLSAALVAAQLLTWISAFWSALDSGQRVGVLLMTLLAAAAILAAAWRARPRVTTQTRVVTTRVSRRTQGGVSEDQTRTGELVADWKPTSRPDADYEADVSAEDPGRS